MIRWMLIIGSLISTQVSAFSWDDLWYNNNQQAIRAYRANDHATAAQKFSSDKTPKGYYNHGNALAKQKKLKEAIHAYEQALNQQPNFVDAKFNHDLLNKMQEQQKKRNQQSRGKQQQKNQQNKKRQQANNQSQQGQKQQDKRSVQGKDKQQQHAKQDQERRGQDKQQLRTKKDQQQTQSQQQREREQQQSTKQVLRRVPDDPGGLLRRKFMRDYQRRQLESSRW